MHNVRRENHRGFLSQWIFLYQEYDYLIKINIYSILIFREFLFGSYQHDQITWSWSSYFKAVGNWKNSTETWNSHLRDGKNYYRGQGVCLMFRINVLIWGCVLISAMIKTASHRRLVSPLNIGEYYTENSEEKWACSPENVWANYTVRLSDPLCFKRLFK